MDLNLNLVEHRVQFLICYESILFFYFGAMGMIAKIGEYKQRQGFEKLSINGF